MKEPLNLATYPDEIEIATESREAGSEAQPADLAEIYAKYGRLVGRWAQALGGPWVDAEDVMQDVFLIVHGHLGRLKTEAQLGAWLHRVTQNVVHNRRRKYRTRELLNRLGALVRLAPQVERDPSEHVELGETQARVYKILDQMRDRYRDVLIMFEIEGMTGEEIAAALEVKTATVWVWLPRARRDGLARRTAEGEPL